MRLRFAAVGQVINGAVLSRRQIAGTDEQRFRPTLYSGLKAGLTISVPTALWRSTETRNSGLIAVTHLPRAPRRSDLRSLVGGNRQRQKIARQDTDDN